MTLPELGRKRLFLKAQYRRAVLLSRHPNCLLRSGYLSVRLRLLSSCQRTQTRLEYLQDSAVLQH